MKYSNNTYYLLFIGFLLFSSWLNWYQQREGEKVLENSSRILNEPAVGDLIIFKDKGSYHAALLKQKIGKDLFRANYNKDSISLKQIRDFAWLKDQFLNPEHYFDTNDSDFYLTTIITQRSKGNYITGYRYDVYRGSFLNQLFYSYFGLIFTSIFLSLILWLGDRLRSMVIWTRPQYRRIPIYVLGFLLVALVARLRNDPNYFTHSRAAWLMGFIAIVPTLILSRYISQNYLKDGNFEYKSLWQGVTLLVGGTTFYLVSFYVARALETRLDSPFKTVYLDAELGKILVEGFLFWTILVGAYLLDKIRKNYFQIKSQQIELVNAKKATLALEAELGALQARVNPHFLYNSLNSIASLATIDPAKTEEMALALSRFYQYNINREDKYLVSIDSEIEMLQNYLQIEKVRFGESLDYHFAVSAETNDWMIPRFLLQPIVENAIKYGYNEKKRGTAISITINAKPHLLQIDIEDSGKLFDNNLSGGYGLRSVQKKLALVYDRKAEISFNNSPRKKVSIKIER